MFTLESKSKKSTAYIAAILFCLLFSYIYNRFSHGVHSIYMTYLFTIPLVLGAAPYIILKLTGDRLKTYWLSEYLWNSGAAALTLSSALRGIFEIAGNSSIYQEILGYVGLLLIVFAIAVQIIKKRS